MLSLLLSVVSHVPTYSGCNMNCCTPPKHHSISQVIYLKGSGGLEIHVDSLTSPFDIAGGEIIDFDAVFRDEIDQSTYSLYVGCGGCVPGDPIVIPEAQLSGYEVADLEPFTQTIYRSVYEKGPQRAFNASLLHPDVCPEKHFTVRLVDHGNRSDGKPIVWGAVVGLGEQFTFLEIVEFPTYVSTPAALYGNHTI